MIKSVAENSILKIVAIAFDASKVQIFANLLPSLRTNPFGKVNISLEFPSIFSQTFGTHLSFIENTIKRIIMKKKNMKSIPFY